jgi:hypothetical protein
MVISLSFLVCLQRVLVFWPENVADPARNFTIVPKQTTYYYGTRTTLIFDFRYIIRYRFPPPSALATSTSYVLRSPLPSRSVLPERPPVEPNGFPDVVIMFNPHGDLNSGTSVLIFGINLRRNFRVLLSQRTYQSFFCYSCKFDAGRGVGEEDTTKGVCT